MLTGAILLVSMVVFLAVGAPIVAAIGVASIISMLYAGSYNALPAITQKMFTSIDSFPLLALPLFILSGALMEVSGISERLVAFMKMLFRRLPAASACITTISATFFGAISGSAPATAAAIGSVMIRPMIRNGYKPEDAAAINAVSGSLGIIIPPSIPMVVFATIASVSVGSLFMAGVVPGLLLMAVLCGMHMAKFRHVEKVEVEKIPFSERKRIFFDASFALGMPLVILGGIYGGIFTATEAAAVSCVYALIVGSLIYRTLPFRTIVDTLMSVGVRVGCMLIIITVATGMAWYISSSGLTRVVADAVLSSLENRILILGAINMLLFFLGFFLDPTSIFLLTCPVIMPITHSFGMSPVAVGAFMVVNMAVGMVTPPMAGPLYISSQIAGLETISVMTRRLIPYIIAMLGITLLMTYFQDISIALPRAMGMPV